jgi:hypothetical protein
MDPHSQLVMPNIVDRAGGHLWTVGPKLIETLRPPRAPESVSWRRRVDTRSGAPVWVTGQYRQRPSSDTLVILVHGLGGCADSTYVRDAAAQVDDHGYSTLRLSLRGAPRDGEDMYHAGLVADLKAALTDSTFERYRRIWVIGFSMGGHLTLRAALDCDVDRFERAAAICSPLDLSVAQRNLDAPSSLVYREYILRELRAMYREVSRRGRGTAPLTRVQQVGSLREWDALTVVPRWGFGTVEHYYQTVSVAGDLAELERPSLLVASRGDPMVSPATIEPGLENASKALSVAWADRGGHVYLPPSLDLGFSGESGVIGQVLGWMSRESRNEVRRDVENNM